MFASLGLKDFRSRLGLNCYRSRSQVYYLETLNTATIWLTKTSVVQHYLSAASAGKKKARNSKKIPISQW